MASALFGALPGEQARAAGVQAPVSLAPAGSPLVSPAGFGPGVPGTPIPQGQVPGTNLLPASPTPVLSLAHRAPALLPHAAAGNGLPDNVVTQLPAYEPRFGSGVLGVPEAMRHPATGSASPFYFVSDSLGHPSAGGLPLAAPIGEDFVPAALAPSAAPSALGSAAPTRPATTPAGVISSEPKYYFVDSVVLPNGYVTPAKPAPHATVSVSSAGQRPPFDVNAIRRDFPILQERVNGKPLVWLDNAATTHKPQSVIDRIAYFYAHENSNIHRAAHELAARATDAYEGARERVKTFINAPDVNEVIFVRGTTEAINLVAKSWGAQHIGAGDEIIVSNLEHHANIVPWQQLAAAKGAKLRVIPVDDSGQVLLDEYQKLL
ncbi:MAG: aminotransferase class V-fold PLP-dependent enzyme, partial [Burkholderiaceae bacterium]|nr:aminotransferase class V-fold PLP-dependent enzyme [Burkholderiaceae bacterium]